MIGDPAKADPADPTLEKDASEGRIHPILALFLLSMNREDRRAWVKRNTTTTALRAAALRSKGATRRIQ